MSVNRRVFDSIEGKGRAIGVPPTEGARDPSVQTRVRTKGAQGPPLVEPHIECKNRFGSGAITGTSQFDDLVGRLDRCGCR